VIFANHEESCRESRELCKRNAELNQASTCVTRRFGEQQTNGGVRSFVRSFI
jgi:hypothetical protein